MLCFDKFGNNHYILCIFLVQMFWVVVNHIMSYNNINGKKYQNIVLRGVNEMKMFHENMIWHDIKDIKRFTQNIKENKNKKTKKTSSILLAISQYTYNYTQGLKRQSAYDAASILYSNMNWIKKRHLTKAFDENGDEIKPKNRRAILYRLREYF